MSRGACTSARGRFPRRVLMLPDVIGEAFLRRSSRWRWIGGLRGLADLGALPSDSAEVRLRKSVLVLSSSLMASLAFVWVGTYAVLGLWLSAAIPFAYQLALRRASMCLRAPGDFACFVRASCG